MLRPHPSRLWLRLAWPVLLYVVAGSLALVLWLHTSARRESRSVFATLANTNADFIRSARLPANERVAESIGRVLNMQVFFRYGSWEMAPATTGAISFVKGLELVPPPSGKLEKHAALIRELTMPEGIARAGPDFEAIAVPIEKEVSLVLVRPMEPAFSFLLRPQTLFVLGAFWLLSVVLAWSLTRGLVRPLRLIAERLPHIEDDSARTLPGAERPDEIGQLARAYLHTRAQLSDERSQRQKSERLALLGRMATGLAHEIHNPLAAIRMHAQLIDSTPDHELAGAARESLPVLIGEAAKIEGLVNQWMFLARPAPPQTARADLAEIVAGVVRALTPQAAHARVELVNRALCGLPTRVDARRLAQAIGNVILNAIQAMPGGGSVHIDGSAAEVVRLSFRDTGRGFSAKALAHHAELFFSEKEGGMGIGLSVTSEILRAHAGSLHVGNAPEGGGLVTFILPVNQLMVDS
ncbi:MAG: two-component system, NtrC family, sensor histidine kinase HydH [Chthoniobacter sp.]|jgi:signal transduction histidine kinase|nr:two-component system, NtrC family, sensor histidine kinase HydH [Chthoniobacter sp.]